MEASAQEIADEILVRTGKSIFKVWTLRAAAKQLGVSYQSLRDLVDRGLPAFCVGRQWQIYEDDLIDFLRGQTPKNQGVKQERSGGEREQSGLTQEV
ncbi:MAG: helix-turn-helix domain-containing protein [Planctomycetota bacterium]